MAAFTLPTLINNYRKTVTVNQLKYAYSTLNQVFTMAQKDYGPMSEWDIAGFTLDMDSDAQEVDDSLRNFAHKYMKPYLKVMIDCDAGSSRKSQCDYPIYLEKGVLQSSQQRYSNDYRFITNNGMIIKMHYDNDGVKNYGGGIFMWVDINGTQKPNTYGEDLFCMYLKRSTGAFNMFGIGETRENMLNGVRGCNVPASPHQGQWCGALIQYDGWKISDDYPRFK